MPRKNAISPLSKTHELQRVAARLNGVLLENNPQRFSSVWISTHVPTCYRFIRRNIRSEVGRIDWDKITLALEPKYQRLWAPRVRKSKSYKDKTELSLILNKYGNKLYVFVAARDLEDLRIRDQIAIALVRVAQAGNLCAQAEVLTLLEYTVTGWIDKYRSLVRWIGHEDEIRQQLKGCIRRYRYSGSFCRYVFRTLEYAARGIRPLYARPFDDSIGY